MKETGTCSVSERTSSTSNMKFRNFFRFLWIIFALLDPDPGSSDLIESGTNPDPNPKHCYMQGFQANKESRIVFGSVYSNLNLKVIKLKFILRILPLTHGRKLL
jgi:hypothetical protein